MNNIEAKKQIVTYIYYAIEDIPEDVGKALDSIGKICIMQTD